MRIALSHRCERCGHEFESAATFTDAPTKADLEALNELALAAHRMHSCYTDEQYFNHGMKHAGMLDQCDEPDCRGRGREGREA